MPLEPATAENVQEIVDCGRIMYEAGKRMVRGIQRLRGSATESEWRFGDHPYLILGLSVGALIVAGAVLRHRD